MSDVAVLNLALTLPRAVSPHGARARIEDALRCAGDDPRLLLLRRLSLGVVPSRHGRTLQADWNSRTEKLLRAAAADAVHATTPGADRREAVYFTDALEARALLIRLLAAGGRPAAWFWRLAVREWTGGDWAQTAGRLLPDLAARPGGSVALARVVRRLIAEGNATRLLAPVTGPLAATLLPPPARAGPAAASSGPHADIAELARVASPAPGPAAIATGRARPAGRRTSPRSVRGKQTAHAAGVVTLAERLRGALTPVETAALRAELLRRNADDPVAVWLVAQLVLEGAPTLACAPAIMIEVAEMLRTAIVALPAVQVSPPLPGPAAQPPIAAPTPRPALAAAPRGADPAPPGPDTGPPALEPAPVVAEQRSEAAGLFLLVRPLVLLGLPEWLDAEPGEALGGFGWALLAGIAARMRVPAADPLWRVMPEAKGTAGWLTAWRVGLDRWLRRRTRARLADVVRRPGWLILADDLTLVRFRLASADIRLRRHALDVDPGWVPWLGHTIRYVYDDRPVVGMDRP